MTRLPSGMPLQTPVQADTARLGDAVRHPTFKRFLRPAISWRTRSRKWLPEAPRVSRMMLRLCGLMWGWNWPSCRATQQQAEPQIRILGL